MLLPVGSSSPPAPNKAYLGARVVHDDVQVQESWRSKNVLEGFIYISGGSLKGTQTWTVPVVLGVFDTVRVVQGLNEAYVSAKAVSQPTDSKPPAYPPPQLNHCSKNHHRPIKKLGRSKGKITCDLGC